MAISAEQLEEVRQPSTWYGSESRGNYELVRALVESEVLEPMPLSHALKQVHHFFMPVGDGYSSVAPPRTIGVPLAKRALELGQRALREHGVADTAEWKGLAAWVHTLEALSLVAPENGALPSPQALDAAADHLRAARNIAAEKVVNTRLFYGFELSDIEGRLLAWRMRAAGAPYTPQAWEAFSAMAEKGANSLLAWPFDPLTTDPAFRSWAQGELRARTEHRPVLDFGVTFSELFSRDEATPENGVARVQLLVLAGIGPVNFARWVCDCINGSVDAALAVLLGLGFDPNVESPMMQGHTLLHQAVRNSNVNAAKALVAAGGQPTRTLLGGAGSALEAATKKGRKAMIKALGAAAGPDDSATTFTARITQALTTFDRQSLQSVASLYAGRVDDFDALVEHLLSKKPDSGTQFARDALQRHFNLYEAYAAILLVRHAGLAEDFKHTGALVLDEALVVTGNATITGPLIDGLEGHFIFVGGNLKASALVTRHDCIVGGDLTVRDFVWGDGNDHLLVVEGTLKTPLLVSTDHGDEAGVYAVGENVDTRARIAELFEPSLFDDEGLDRAKVIARLKLRKSVLR